MTRTRSSLLVVGIVGWVFLAACEKPSQSSSATDVLVRGSTAYPDPADQKQFREALASASIPHDVFTGPDGKEYIGWDGEHDAAVQKITVRLFGEPLPTGRHIHFSGEYGEQFKDWLKSNGIPYTVQMKRGKEYVIWQAEDSPRVAKWTHFPATYWSSVESSSRP